MKSVDERIKDIYWTFRNETENRDMIKSLIKDICEEVIMPDEKLEMHDNKMVAYNVENYDIMARNKFRTEQRTKLNTLLKESEGK